MIRGVRVLVACEYVQVPSDAMRRMVENVSAANVAPANGAA